MISPVDSLPLPEVGTKFEKVDVMTGENFLPETTIEIASKKKMKIGKKIEQSFLMVLSCKNIYFMQPGELPDNLKSNHPDCCLFYKQIKAPAASGQTDEPGKKKEEAKIINNWICSHTEHRCVWELLKIAKSLHHYCHDEVKELMHTKLKPKPKKVEFYNDLNLDRKFLKAPRGYTWVDGYGYLSPEQLNAIKKGLSLDGEGGKSGERDVRFCHRFKSQTLVTRQRHNHPKC